MRDINNSEDILDVRDIIARVEELREERDEAETEASEGHAAFGFGSEEREELATLESLLEDLRGNGGDEQWNGDWYPVTLIRDSYFEDYAEQLAEDIGAISSDAQWPLHCIDWEKAARELQIDYSTVDYDGVEYWYR